ncbi:MAG: hypothetical protein ACRER2_02905 [Methylococcales bacterium]
MIGNWNIVQGIRTRIDRYRTEHHFLFGFARDLAESEQFVRQIQRGGFASKQRKNRIPGLSIYATRGLLKDRAWMLLYGPTTDFLISKMIQLTRHVGRDCRHPEHKDVLGPLPSVASGFRQSLPV